MSISNNEFTDSSVQTVCLDGKEYITPDDQGAIHTGFEFSYDENGELQCVDMPPTIMPCDVMRGTPVVTVESMCEAFPELPRPYDQLLIKYAEYTLEEYMSATPQRQQEILQKGAEYDNQMRKLAEEVEAMMKPEKTRETNSGQTNIHTSESHSTPLQQPCQQPSSPVPQPCQWQHYQRFTSGYGGPQPPYPQYGNTQPPYGYCVSQPPYGYCVSQPPMSYHLQYGGYNTQQPTYQQPYGTAVSNCTPNPPIVQSANAMTVVQQGGVVNGGTHPPAVLSSTPLPYPAEAIDKARRNHLLRSIVILHLLLEAGNNIGRNQSLPPCWKGKSLWDTLRVHPYDLLPASSQFDNGQCFFTLPKVISLADDFNLDAQHPFNAPAENLLDHQGKDTFYGLSHNKDSCFRGYPDIIRVYGEYGAIVENWRRVQYDRDNIMFVPVSTVVNKDFEHIHLPIARSKYHLQGFYDQCGNPPDPGEERVLTPSNQTWYANQTVLEKRYITWMGEGETVDKVDWTPLYDKSVTYLVDPTFFISQAQCLRCMRDVCQRLADNGCRIKLRFTNIPGAKNVEDIDYDPNELCRVYKILEVPVPADVVDYDEWIVPQTDDIAPKTLITRMFNHKDIVIVCGPAGIGKSYYIDSLAYALVHGKDLCERFKTPEAQSVLVLNGEMTPEEIAERNRKYEKMFGKQNMEQKDEQKTFLETLPFPFKLDAPEGMGKLRGLLAHLKKEHPGEKPVSAVIIDSLKTMTNAGDERSGWKEISNGLNALRNEFGVTFIIIHHTNKTGESFGTVDTTVKVEAELMLTRDVKRAIPPEYLMIDKDYEQTLACRLAEWQIAHPDDIWFFQVNGKVRSGKKSDRRPVLMHMCPEDGNPQWQCIDFLDPSHEWSPNVLKAENCTEENVVVAGDVSADASMPTQGTIATLSDMDGMSRDRVLEVLHGSYIAGNTTREMVGKSFGTSKSGIDYLAKKFNFANKDFMYPDPDVTA